jgi:hypothetical protein
VRRARIIIVVGFAAFVFLGLSGLMARALTGAGDERSRVVELLEAQAAGDAERALAVLPACRGEPACVQVMRDRVAELRRPGDVEILTYDPSVRIALTSRTGVGRVAWRAGASAPVVQCVRVRREGPVSGGDVELLSISAPIGREESCP